MKIFVLTSLLLVLLHYVLSECGQKYHRMQDAKLQVLGLFSLTKSGTRHNYNIDAMIRELEISAFFNKSTFPLGYTAIDVCDDVSIFLQSIVDTVLDNSTSKTTAIVTFVSFEWTQLAASILLVSEIKYYAYTFKPMYPFQLTAHFKNVYSYDHNLLNIINELKENLLFYNFTRVSAFHLCSRSLKCKSEIDFFAPLKNTGRICIKQKLVDTSNFTDVDFNVQKIKSDQSMGTVLLFGEALTLLFIESSLQALKFTKYKTFIVDYKTFNACEGLTRSFVVYAVDNNFSLCTSEASRRKNMEVQFLKEFWAYLGLVVSSTTLPLPASIKRHFTQGDLFQRSNDSIYKSDCKRPLCGRGYESKFDEFTEQEWHKSYGWHCKMCQGNTFKSEVGYHECMPCRLGFVRNKLGTSCRDPYTDVYINLDEIGSRVFILLSLICSLIMLVTLVIFYKYRETPVVLSSDRNMAFLQLASQILLSLSLPMVFIGRPINITCFIRPIIVGIYLTINSSVTLCKTQKLLLVFQAKIKMTRKEITITKAVQYFSLFLIVLTDAIILVITFEYKTTSVKHLEQKYQKLREVFCSTFAHTHVQLGFILLILICNTIQGFRARGLPTNYRETKFITISSFLSCLLLGATSLINYSQPDQLIKDRVTMFMILCLNFIHFIVLYGYKVYIIIFKPNINNHNVFRAGLMKSVIKQTNDDISVRTDYLRFET